MTREPTETMELFEKEKHSPLKATQVKVCNVCGDRGFSNALVYCSQCSDTAVHQYCVGIPPGSLDGICSLVCEYCSPVMEPESCTCNALASYFDERSPGSCVVHGEALTMKGKSEVMVIPDQPALAGTRYLVACKGNLENEETRSCSQFSDVNEPTGSISLGNLLDYREENEFHAQNARDSVSRRSLNHVEEPEAQVSSLAEHPEHISGKPVLLVEPSGEIISHFGITSFMEYLESIMCRVVFVVSPSGKIKISRSKIFCDNLNAPNAEDNASSHRLNFVEKPEVHVSSLVHKSCGEVVLLVKPSGEITIHREIRSDFVRKQGPLTVTSGSFSHDGATDTDREFVYDFSVEHIDPISVLYKETDVEGDMCSEYPYDAPNNIEGNIQQSYEVLDVDGLTGMGSGYKQGIKRKKTTAECEHLRPLMPDCKRARSERCKLCHFSERRSLFPNSLLRARGSSSCNDVCELEREEDLIKGEALPRRSRFKRHAKAMADPAWMMEEWDGKDLRLKPDVHLSASAPREVAERTRSFGSLTLVMESLDFLSEGARSIILSGAFGPVVASWSRVVQLQAKVDKVLLRGFLERFWDTTNSFHMPFGEVGITMTDFVMISGLPSSGHRIEFNEHLTLSSKGMRDLLGRHLPQTVYKYYKNVPYSYFESYFRKDEGNMDEATDEQNARVWLWYFLGATFFAEKGSRCSTRYLYLLRDLGALGNYNWAAAAYSNYIWYLRAAVRLKDPDSGSQVGVVGPGHILEAWIFSYFPSFAPTNPADPAHFPAVERWAACRQRRVFRSLNDVRKAINGLTTDDFVARPWVGYERIPDFVAGSRIMDRTRVLLKGPYGLVWFLGERMARQTTTDRFVVPVDPPVSMFRCTRLRRGEVEEAMSGRPMIDFLLPKPDYRKYVARRLAWHAIEVPGDEHLSNFLSQLAQLLQH